jgi:hypothetical protein
VIDIYFRKTKKKLMSSHMRAKAKQKCKRISAERALQRLSNDTPMSVTERVRRHRERRRVKAADDSASISSAALPEPMEVQTMAKSPDPSETYSEPMQFGFHHKRRDAGALECCQRAFAHGVHR